MYMERALAVQQKNNILTLDLTQFCNLLKR